MRFSNNVSNTAKIRNKHRAVCVSVKSYLMLHKIEINTGNGSTFNSYEGVSNTHGEHGTFNCNRKIRSGKILKRQCQLLDGILLLLLLSSIKERNIPKVLCLFSPPFFCSVCGFYIRCLRLFMFSFAYFRQFMLPPNSYVWTSSTFRRRLRL